MKSEMLYEIIRAPHISEKSTDLSERLKQVVFKVAKQSTKRQVKDAVEQLFKVQVKSVTTTSVHNKPWKKATVSLMPDQDIDFANGV